MFSAVQRSAYQEINLDDLTHNVNIVRKLCTNSDIGIIGVVKSGAYGHGSVYISKHLKEIGVERLAVATVDEGIYLRQNGVSGPIHVLGNIQSYEVSQCLDHGLVPTISAIESVKQISTFMNNRDEWKMLNDGYIHHDSGNIPPLPNVHVNIKVDTGMSRYGCLVDEIRDIMKACEDNGIVTDALYTHFAASINEDVTKTQLKIFHDAVEPIRNKNIKLHVSNSGAIVNGAIGTDLDFVRPGMCMYGTPTENILPQFLKYNFKPICTIKATPAFVKKLPAGKKVGYSFSYESQGEWVGTFALGYTDGIRRKLGSNGQAIRGYIKRDKTGEKCPIIGKIGMDSMTVSLPEETTEQETFSMITNDYDIDTSALGIASKAETISNEILVGCIGRYSKVYVKKGHDPIIVKALRPDSY